MNRKIRLLLISDEQEDYLKLMKYLEKDYDDVLTVIFYLLSDLLKEAKRNESRLNNAINKIFKISEELTDVKQIVLINKKINYFINKIDQTIPRKRKRNSVITNLRNECIKEHNKLNKRIKQYNINDTYTFLTKLLFEEKNIIKSEKVIIENIDVIISKEKDGIDLVYELLSQYKTLEVNDKDIAYYNSLLNQLLKIEKLSFINKNIEKYIDLLIDKCYESHIKHVIDKLENNSLLIEELEEQTNISFNIPDKVLKEASGFKSNIEFINDYTNMLTITIDGPGAHCLDDAISLEKTESGYKLYVHITDIPSVIPYYSLTNKEAFKRGETLYLSDCQIMMYPSFLSDGIMSLLPNDKKNVLTYIYEVDDNFNINIDYLKVKRGIINSSHQLTYEAADYIIKHSKQDEISEMLCNLANISLKLRDSNKNKEEYRKIENIVKSNKLHESVLVDYSISANIIQELMVLVNSSVAKYFNKLGYPYIYRVHEIPTEDILLTDIRSLLDFNSSNYINQNYKKIIETIKNGYLNARYATENIGHQGLGLDYYSHSTSPARRYADSYGQYIIEDLLLNRNISDNNIYMWEDKTKEVVAYLNQKHIDNEMFEKEYNFLQSKQLIRKKEE